MTSFNSIKYQSFNFNSLVWVSGPLPPMSFLASLSSFSRDYIPYNLLYSQHLPKPSLCVQTRASLNDNWGLKQILRYMFYFKWENYILDLFINKCHYSVIKYDLFCFIKTKRKYIFVDGPKTCDLVALPLDWLYIDPDYSI